MVVMNGKDTLVPKKRGPAPTGKGTQIQVRLQPDMLNKLDRWIEQNDATQSRPQAIRAIIARVTS